jgi:hypothetical protein
MTQALYAHMNNKTIKKKKTKQNTTKKYDTVCSQSTFPKPQKILYLQHLVIEFIIELAVLYLLMK